jgi:hypothetical protein
VILSVVLCFFATQTFAQAADVDAIDFTGKMDTVARWTNDYDILGSLNAGSQNTDQWDDLELFISPDTDSYNISRLRFGGSLLFDSVNNPAVYELPTVCADLDGDGIKDLIVDNYWFHKGRKTFPYYDSTTNVTLHLHGFSPYLIGATDYDNDGITDILHLSDDRYILLYKGGTSFTQNYAYDSLKIPNQTFFGTVGNFRDNKPNIVFGWDNKLYFIKHDTAKLHDEKPVLISDTTSSDSISILQIYAMDITNDGIADLLISDGFNIYIFKGGSDFGTYPLSKKTAYYRIKSPRLLDFGNYGFLQNFGIKMRSCGDITGSGIPYVAVSAEVNEAGGYRGYEFFYAGGKALDSLFDAMIVVSNQAVILNDTLHSINSTGRSACLIDIGRASGGFDNELLLFKNCDKIPHKTNPQMSVVANSSDSFSISIFPSIANKFIKLLVNSSKNQNGIIEIYDLLGRRIDKREVKLDTGENTEFYNTTQFAEGTFIVHCSANGEEFTSKFIIHH